jgi:hypothetical protein
VTKNNFLKYWILFFFLLFIAYLFAATQPIPEETILVPRWLSSLESNYPVYFDGSSLSPDMPESAAEEDFLFPFELGERYGYIDAAGRFTINRIKQGYLSISTDRWAEYDPVPGTITVQDPRDRPLVTIKEGRGYPLFLDNKIFLINDEQNSLTALDDTGAVRWSYDFAAVLTDIDAAAGLIVAGFLDGTVEVLDQEGNRIFFFEPGGSRFSIITGCRISKDGSRLAIISGYDDQRFLLLEKSGDSYKVVYHEFLSDGFRRNVFLAFIDHDRRIAFERDGGLGIYDTVTRKSVKIALQGEVLALDNTGEDNLLFLITGQTKVRNELVAIRLPGSIIMEVPFRSERVFLGRLGKRLYIGGGGIMAAFELDTR